MSERSELYTIWVTPEVKEELEENAENKKRQEEIIRTYISYEKDWLEGEIREVDNITLRYRAMLASIADAFKEEQQKHLDYCNQIVDDATKVFSKIDNITSDLESKMSKAVRNLKGLEDKIHDVNYYSLERLLNAVEKYNDMTDEEKELVGLLLNK